MPLSDTQDAVADYSRAFGRMIHTVDAAPQAVVGMLEGAVLGGGFGVGCVTDVAIGLLSRIPAHSLELAPRVGEGVIYETTGVHTTTYLLTTK